MQVGSTGSVLSEYIEKSSAGSRPGHSESAYYQEFTASLGIKDAEVADASQSLDTPATPGALTREAVEAAGSSQAGEPPYVLSVSPIWDTGWEIEPQSPDLGQAAISSLRSLFAKNGLNDDSVKLSYIEELAVCPGVRSWVNRSVVVEYPDGQLEKFSAEWTQKRPEWTLCSMLERMGAEGPVQVVV